MNESAGNCMDVGGLSQAEEGRGLGWGPSNNHREPVDRRQEDERKR